MSNQFVKYWQVGKVPTPKEKVIEEVYFRFGEWIEQSKNPDTLIIELLASMVAIERERVEWLKSLESIK